MLMQNQPHQSLLAQALQILRSAVSGYPYASQSELARASGESEANISRWLSGAVTPTLRKLEPVLMALGVGFTIRKTTHIRITQADLLSSDNMLADLDSWSSLADGTAKRRFLRLRMPQKDVSMQPAIFPGDIVLVDTADTILKDRKIYLVHLMEQGFAFRRAFSDDNEPERYILCPDNTAAGCKPLLQNTEHTPHIIGTVRNSIRAFL
ncbi:MAG: helix-turn-helix domain-containing protein [Desulfovibrio sp.]|nr:helix-turn-helix domain-containing protein [Desulfovibrio sp.]